MLQLLLTHLLPSFLPLWPANVAVWFLGFRLVHDMMVTALLSFSSSRCRQLRLTDRVPPDPNGTWTSVQSRAVLGVVGVPLLLFFVGWMESVYGGVPKGFQRQLIVFGGRLWLGSLRSVLAYFPWDVWLFSEFSTGIVLHVPGIGDGHPGVCSGVITPQYKRFKRGGRQLIWVTTRFGSAPPGPFWTVFLFGLWFCVDLIARSMREFLCCSFGSLRASALTIFGLLAECSGSPLGVADDPDFSDVDGAVLAGRGPGSLESAPRGRLCHPTPLDEAAPDDVGDTEPSPFVLDWASDWFILLQVLLCFGLPVLWALRRSIWWHPTFGLLVLLVTFGGLQAASFQALEHGGVTRLESSHLLACDLAYTFVSDAISAMWRASLVLPSSGSTFITLDRAASLSLLLRVGPVALFGWFGSPPTGPSSAVDARCPLPSPSADALQRLPSSPLWWDPLFGLLHPRAFEGLYADGAVVELPPSVTCGVPYPDLGACSVALDVAVLSESTRRAIADSTSDPDGRLPAEDLHSDDAPPPEPPPFEMSRWLGSFDPSRIMDTLSFRFDRNLRVGCDLGRVLPARCLTGVLGDLPLIVDTGASVSITPALTDFITYEPCDASIKDLSSQNKVAGRGLVRWTVLDSRGLPCALQVRAYHVPNADVRLLSPQGLFDTGGGSGSITNMRVVLNLASGRVLHADVCRVSKLPVLQLSPRPEVSVSPLENVFSVQTEHNRWFVAGERALNNAPDIQILHDSNTNLSASQKEFLRWHERLSHASFNRIIMLMRTVSWLKTDHDGVALHRGPFIPCEHRLVTVRDIRSLRCVACLEAKAHIRSPPSQRRTGTQFRQAAMDLARNQRLLSDDEFRQLLKDFTARIEGRAPPLVLKRDDLKPGDRISMDHYKSSTVGRLPNSFGREAHGFTCGTLFVDHASGKIFNYCQHSTAAEETVQNKHRLETAARIAGVSIKRYHADNGTFDSATFRDDCDRQSQVYDFSAPHSQFQNGVVERNIGTIMRWARANLLHLARHWPRGNCDYSRLWPFAVDYAIWVFNRLPRMDCGICPEELWSGGRGSSRHDDFSRAHKFGCPVFVLDNDLADGHRIPRWHPRARLGMFLGFSPHHSSLAPLVLNLATGKITVCYHAIFNDDFTTVASSALDRRTPLDAAWETILTLDGGRELFLDPEEMVDESGRVVPLDSVWCPRESEGASEGVSEGVSEGAVVSDGAVASRTRSRAPVVAHAKDVSDARLWGQPPPAIARQRLSVRSQLQPPRRWGRALLSTLPILKDAWADVGSDFLALHQHIDRDPFDSRLAESFDPRVLAARSSKYNEDNPSWTMAMQGEFQHEYFEAMETELRTLDDDMHCWDYVERTKDMKVLPSTWAFKCKRYPDGRERNSKPALSFVGTARPRASISFRPGLLWLSGLLCGQ